MASTNSSKQQIISSLPLRYRHIRGDSEELCKPLEIEDYGIQTMPEVSPPKWHIAHTSWFFETLLLKPFVQNYQAFNPIFAHLFNSYYDTLGSYHPRPERGLLSRPTVDEVYAYRAYIDEQMAQLLAQIDHPQWHEIAMRTELGLNHEQQHQELMLTDIKNIFAYNPLQPAYRELPLPAESKSAESKSAGSMSAELMSTIPLSTKQAPQLELIEFEGGIKSIGHKGEGFAFDNEQPRHQVYLNDFRLASRLVTNGEYIEFMNSGSYQQPEYWLSDAWKIILQQHWQAPLYWQQIDNEWWQMTLAGLRKVDMQAPVCHVSYYEASAYALWAGKRLPSEAEWEVAAFNLEVEGNLREKGFLQPAPAHPASLPSTSKNTSKNNQQSLLQMYGDVWEWTQSPYMPYPGYQPPEGSLAEYNGKFMSSQMVLRGGSCVTPSNHIRPQYRNFFYPHERWQFSGLRLAENVS